MNTKSRRFKAVDILLLAGAILPFLAAIALKVLTTAPFAANTFSKKRRLSEMHLPCK